MATLTDVLDWFYKPFTDSHNRFREMCKHKFEPRKVNWDGYVAGVDMAAPGSESKVCVTCWRKDGDSLTRIKNTTKER